MEENLSKEPEQVGKCNCDIENELIGYHTIFLNFSWCT